jgi:hypothetical protein
MSGNREIRRSVLGRLSGGQFYTSRRQGGRNDFFPEEVMCPPFGVIGGQLPPYSSARVDKVRFTRFTVTQNRGFFSF